MLEDYVIRKAAGANWLICTTQDEERYISPVIINESAAYIIEQLKSGMSIEEISAGIAHESRISVKVIEADIKELIKNISKI